MGPDRKAAVRLSPAGPGRRADASKPIQSIIENFTGDENDPGIRRHRETKRDPKPLGWKLAEPIAFVDSRNHPAVQLADIIAGTTVALFSGSLAGKQEAEPIANSIARHGLDDSILPDMDIINPANRSAAVNALILYDMAKKAERHANPYENLEAMYHLAEVSWARGDFGQILRGRDPGSK